MRSRASRRDLKTLIKHLLISHHGEYEFGSPKLPMFREALVLHYLDDLDSKMGAARAVLGADGGEAGWTAFSPALNRQTASPRSIPRGARSGRFGASGEGPETRRGSRSENEALQLREAMGTFDTGCSRDSALDFGSGSAGARLHECAVAAGRGHGARHSAALATTRPRAYTTIMTILDRLAQKGVVGRQKAGRAWLYTPNLSAEQARSHAVAQVGGRILSRLDGGAGLACNEPEPHSGGDSEPRRRRATAKDGGLMGSRPV